MKVVENDANDDEVVEETVEELIEELIGKTKPIDYKRMIKAVQEAENARDIAIQNIKAAYAPMVNKGHSQVGLKQIVARQQKPKPTNARIAATVACYEAVTGQKDLLN